MMRKSPSQPYTVQYFLDRSSPEPNSGCWIWMNSATWNGYGFVKVNGVSTTAHRLAYETANQVTLDPAIDVCHRCDNRICVNPDHLFLGTRTVNMRDCANKGRIKTPWYRGAAHPMAKLTDAQVIAIKSDLRNYSAISNSYGVSKNLISQIKAGKIWRHL